MELIPFSQHQYKANLHSHTVLSDGGLTPEAMKEAYRAHGYSVLAITDHEAPYDHTDLTTDDFLMITGYEAYLRPNEECEFDDYGPEIHMNLLAEDPHNTTFVCYDEKFVKYMPHNLARERVHAGPEGRHSYDVEFINAFIAEARRTGYLVTYNHPVWSMEEPEDILKYHGYFSLEIFNTGSHTISGFENNMALYDRLLRHGIFPYVHGTDDNHNHKPLDDPMSDSFGAWTMIYAPELSYSAIMDALRSGHFYASTGPEIRALFVEGTHVTLECSPAERVILHLTPKRTWVAYDPAGADITRAEFELPPEAPYVYFSVYTRDGHAAHTHAFRREELGL